MHGRFRDADLLLAPLLIGSIPSNTSSADCNYRRSWDRPKNHPLLPGKDILMVTSPVSLISIQNGMIVIPIENRNQYHLEYPRLAPVTPRAVDSKHSDFGKREHA
jgi:hypothetical protein